MVDYPNKNLQEFLKKKGKKNLVIELRVLMKKREMEGNQRKSLIRNLLGLLSMFLPAGLEVERGSRYPAFLYMFYFIFFLLKCRFRD